MKVLLRSTISLLFFLPARSASFLQSVELSSYDSGFIYFSFQLYWFLPHAVWCSIVSFEAIVTDRHIFLENWLFFFFFLGLRLQHMKVPKLEVKSEMKLPAYTTTIATLDLSCLCNLYCSLLQCWIINPLATIEPTSSWTLCQVLNLLSQMGTLKTDSLSLISFLSLKSTLRLK